MTRKHFIELAAIAGLIRDPVERAYIAGMLAQFCAKHNEQFDGKRFIAAVEKGAQ